MTQTTDHILIENAKKDSRSFRPLVDHYQARIYPLAFRFMGNHHDSEEVVQEAFVRLWININKYKPEIKLITWLYKIVSNLCLDRIKSKAKKEEMARTGIEEAETIKSDNHPALNMERSEMMAFILKATEGLTPKQKAVFTLRDLEGLNGEEVSSLLNMKPGNVKSNLNYARLKMGKKLKQYYHEV